MPDDPWSASALPYRSHTGGDFQPQLKPEQNCQYRAVAKTDKWLRSQPDQERRIREQP
jgi:hypothetical protein